MKYYVKTRNWHCNEKLLPILSVFGKRADSYEDGDGKLYFESNYIVPCFLVWIYWLALSRWSGGWTYLKSEKNKEDMGKFKKLYL